MNIVIKIFRISEKLKRLFLSVWISYLAGISVEYISGSSSLPELIRNVFDISKLSVLILWIGAVVVAITWLINLTFDRIRASKKTETRFIKLMKAHTYEVLNRSEQTSYSWGYNKTICVPGNPGGWKPEDIYIDLKNSSIESNYRFSDSNTGLKNYTDAAYKDYCENTPKIQTIRQRGDDKARYGVTHVEKSMKGGKVEIRLRKTNWTQLQFSWDYLRRPGSAGKHPEEEQEINALHVKALDHDKDLLINSFCLHLILVSSNGNAILSRISKVKSNDYPSTWAATLGEQLEKEDFIHAANGELYPDFVTRWVKRALKEELGIDEESLTEQGISELEEYVDMDSLRVLSVDFEGDIYNVALTCVLRLRIDAERLKHIKEITIDSNETTNDFKECSESNAREILLGYPANQREYHPSTYLRLLMFHLYSSKQLTTMNTMVKESGKFHTGIES